MSLAATGENTGRVQARFNHDATSQFLETTIDADEDREIVGVYYVYTGNPNAADKNGFCQLGALERASPANGEGDAVQGDIGIPFAAWASEGEDDTTNGVGSRTADTAFIDLSAAPVFWGQNVTLTIHSDVGGADAGDGDLEVFVYYRIL